MSFIQRFLSPEHTLEDCSVVEEDNVYRIKLKLIRHSAFGDKSISRYYEVCCAGGDPYPFYIKDKQSAENVALSLSKKNKSKYYL